MKLDADQRERAEQLLRDVEAGVVTLDFLCHEYIGVLDQLKVINTKFPPFNIGNLHS